MEFEATDEEGDTLLAYDTITGGVLVKTSATCGVHLNRVQALSFARTILASAIMDQSATEAAEQAAENLSVSGDTTSPDVRPQGAS